MKNNLRVSRTEIRMTQQQLAAAAGVSRQTILPELKCLIFLYIQMFVISLLYYQFHNMQSDGRS